MKTLTFAGFAMAGALALFAQGAMAADEDDPLFEAGRAKFGICKSCHAIVPGTRSLGRGPSLWGVVGRKAGTAPGFADYSEAMKKSTVVWSPETIEKYIANPKGFIPDNAMPYNGLANPKDRQAIVKYIAVMAAKPAPSLVEEGLTMKKATPEQLKPLGPIPVK